ncbi:hypothetical protein BCR42DRAFT_446415 [Absidia repens]|uniref:Uncharacterized protein n=1 Tax=Absidia repens TaxID=90262 RepID=A0A1X2IYY7_9FUNG|nr:hypothetical protein BCR42DRAFT_446415 [Absidia repens]
MNIIKTNTSCLVRQALLTRQQYFKYIIQTSPALLHTSSIQQKSVIDKAKDLSETVKKAGHDVNMKIGEKLAHGIDEAKAATSQAPNAASDLKDDFKAKTEDLRGKAQETKKVMRDRTQHKADQVEEKFGDLGEATEKVRQAGKETLSKGAESVEEAISDTSETLGANEKDFNQAKHRLEDEVEDAVERLQHKRD